jgi:hypothetical protein
MDEVQTPNNTKRKNALSAVLGNLLAFMLVYGTHKYIARHNIVAKLINLFPIIHKCLFISSIYLQYSGLEN